MKSQPKTATAQWSRRKSSSKEIHLLLISREQHSEWLLEKVIETERASLHSIVPEQISAVEGSFDAVILTGDLQSLGGQDLFNEIESHFGAIPVVVVDEAPPKERLKKIPRTLVGYVRLGSELKDALGNALALCKAKLLGTPDN